MADAINEDMYRRTYADVFTGDEHGRRCPFRRVTSSPGIRTRPTCACRPTSRACPGSPGRSRTLPARAASSWWATASRPTTSRPQARSSRTARPAATCSSMVSSARTSTPTARAAGTAEVMVRGYVCQRPAQEPPRAPRARARGRCISRTARSRPSSRRPRQLPGGRRPHDRARRQGVRLGLVARLGGEGAEPPRRPGGDRRELRAHPPLEPDRDGHRAAPSTPTARTQSRSALPATRRSPLEGLETERPERRR